MNLNSHNSDDRSGLGIDRESTGEESLRLIAGLPAPEGLEDRIHAALRAASRHGRVLVWPAALRADAAWVRAAAAAAIVFVVAGGGWGVYSRMQPLQSGKAPAVPARLGTAGGFSDAAARRTPETLNRPVVSEPAKPADEIPSHRKAHKKAAVGELHQSATQPAPAAK